jgi:hypothetical protein
MTSFYSPEVQKSLWNLDELLVDRAGRLRARSQRLPRQAAAGKPGAFFLVVLEDVFIGKF